MDWRIETYDSVGSTQDILKEQAMSGAAEGVVIQGLEQRSGRGRHGNHWISPKGNLYLSILLRPDCSPERAGQLAFVLALAVGETVQFCLAPELQQNVTLKWPNDILFNGLKVSGILLETNIKTNVVDAVFVGVGMNVLAPPDGHVGLRDVCDTVPSIDTCRDVLLDKLAWWYGAWQQKGFAPVRAAWLKQAHGLGQQVTARMPQSQESGIFEGIDGNGALILKQANGITTIQAAEVHFGE